MDKHIKIGCQMHTKTRWKKFTDKQISTMDLHALEFWKENKKWILSL
jgi:hypothetical protein